MQDKEFAFSARNLTKTYVSREGARVNALDGVSFDAPAGGITCIVGPTGSGKTTILRIAAGLDCPDSGTAFTGGRLPGELKGKVDYISQQHSLFPWMKVRDNIGIPLKLRGERPESIREKADLICGLLGLKDAEALYPHELSGGMKQRAALGRLLASGSPYWLMDEPFSAVDERTRHRLQRLLLELSSGRGVSILFVTHSIDEAVFMADRIVVLSAGPGHVVDILDPGLPHPRNRLSTGYGRVIESIRQGIESVLEQGQ